MFFKIFLSIARAADATSAVINPNLPGTESIATGGPLAIIANFYNFALMIGGVLAFGMILYGAVKYMIAAGNPGGQSDAKDQITQALLGLLLLVGAYVVLNTINPALTHPTLPTLKPLPAAPGLSQPPGGTPGTPPPQEYSCFSASGQSGDTCYSDSTCGGACASGETCQSDSECQSPQNPSGSGTCADHQSYYPGSSCSNSPALQAVVTCVANQTGIQTYTTTGGTHNINSCHFGGRYCTDGGHAVDYGFSAIGGLGQALSFINTINSCGASTGHSVSCRCETQGGAQLDPSCTNANDNHIHCNVDNASCGCN